MSYRVNWGKLAESNQVYLAESTASARLDLVNMDTGISTGTVMTVGQLGRWTRLLYKRHGRWQVDMNRVNGHQMGLWWPPPENSNTARQGSSLVSIDNLGNNDHGGGGDRQSSAVGWPENDHKEREFTIGVGGVVGAWPVNGRKCRRKVTTFLAAIVAMTMVGGGLKISVLARRINFGGLPYRRRPASACKWPKRWQRRWKPMNKMASPTATAAVLEEEVGLHWYAAAKWSLWF